MVIVTVAGTSVETKGLEVEQNITHAPDTAHFRMYDPDTAPVSGQEVLIYDEDSTVIFGGVIVSVQKEAITKSSESSYRTYVYSVECSDYQKLLDRYLINNSYTSQTCKQIIDDLVANYTDPAIGFTTTSVSTGPTITKATFSYRRVSDAITELADLVEYDWYVDESKVIHFFQRETIPAPLDISDTTLVESVNSFSLTPDYTQVRNRVYVRGGTYDSAAYTESFTADGLRRSWPLAFKPSGLSITVGGVAKTVAVDHLNPDDGTYQYFYNYLEQYVRCAENVGTTPTPADGVTIAVTYTYQVPIIIMAENLASQTAIAAIEGGTGRYEHIIKDETITTLDEARSVGEMEVLLFGDAIISGSFTTYTNGFKAGQYLNLSATDYLTYSGRYRIQRVRARIIGNNIIQYSVEFATTLYELKDLLLSLIRKHGRYKLRSDEAVDVLKIISESITVTDVNILTVNLHPQKWDSFKWGFGTWGTEWKYKKLMTIDQTVVDGDLTDFPVLVKLSATNFDFSHSLSSGYDIRFMDSTLSRYYKFEIERYDAINQLAEFWVKIPAISGTVDTTFYIVYGKWSANDESKPTSVWDTNFMMVQHMNDATTSTILDSTSNANNGTKQAANEPIEATGKIGKGQTFDGTDDLIKVNPISGLTGLQTVSMWVYPTAFSVNMNRYVLDEGGNNHAANFADPDLNSYPSIYWNSIGGGASAEFTAINTWYYLTFTSEAAGASNAYLNGVLYRTGAGGTLTPDDITIGNYDAGGGYSFLGIIDETRISNIARSAAWIKAEYNSGNNSLLTYGVEEAI